MIYAVVLALALTGHNSYTWSSRTTSVWENADNWGAMDWPHSGDDIVVGQTWGTGWEPVDTINLGGNRNLSNVYVWDSYDTKLINDNLTATEVVGNGNLTINNATLTANSIAINSLIIGSSSPVIVPEPSSFILLIPLIGLILFLRKKHGMS
jgi:hypothetical protein